jgi:hypothetical protein
MRNAQCEGPRNSLQHPRSATCFGFSLIRKITKKKFMIS